MYNSCTSLSRSWKFYQREQVSTLDNECVFRATHFKFKQSSQKCDSLGYSYKVYVPFVLKVPISKEDTFLELTTPSIGNVHKRRTIFLCRIENINSHNYFLFTLYFLKYCIHLGQYIHFNIYWSRNRKNIMKGFLVWFVHFD